jgi:hypothetical protein
MTDNHVDFLLKELSLKNIGKERPWTLNKKTKRLYMAIRKLTYGSMTAKQIEEHYDRLYDKYMAMEVDWGR